MSYQILQKDLDDFEAAFKRTKAPEDRRSIGWNEFFQRRNAEKHQFNCELAVCIHAEQQVALIDIPINPYCNHVIVCNVVDTLFEEFRLIHYPHQFWPAERLFAECLRSTGSLRSRRS